MTATPVMAAVRVPPAGIGEEHVILLGPDGRAIGSAPKHSVHHGSTPLHLGFSCYVVNGAGQVLVTRRAAGKPTWPSVWTNGCCGHPAPGETLRDAVARRLGHELGLVPVAVTPLIGDFAYRAVMSNGVVEHEVCPVVGALVDTEPRANPSEVDGVAWLAWDELVERARREPGTLSPWSVDQIGRLARSTSSPLRWFDDDPGHAAGAIDLDASLGAVSPADPLAPVLGPVDDLLEEFLTACADEAAGLEPLVAGVTREIRNLVIAGGKRLRPAFVYWGHRATGATHDERVLTAAAAVELLHTFALIHDDVMDRSETRRGRPAVHRSLAGQHRADRLLGDSDWFGISAAILAGDLTLVWADRLFESSPLPGAALARARVVFDQLRVEVMVGQYLDVRLAGTPLAAQESAYRVALLKSGRYTVTRPLQLGAALAGAPTGLVDVLRRYGDAVGVAFQLRDDLLGVFGDPAQTGKSAVDDLREGKRTLLVVKALQLAEGPARRRLESALGDRDLDDEAAAQCREIIEQCRARRAVELLVERHHAEAVHAVADVPDGAAREALEQLASSACRRRC